jgi:integration host factor subunit beta
MNRSDIIDRIHKINSDKTTKSLDLLIKILFETMSEHLINKNRIEIRGFGTFAVKSRVGYRTKNPQSGAMLKSNNLNVIYFRAGKNLKQRINKLTNNS